MACALLKFRVTDEAGNCFLAGLAPAGRIPDHVAESGRRRAPHPATVLEKNEIARVSHEEKTRIEGS